LAGAFDELTGGTVFDSAGSKHPAVYVAGQATQFGLTNAASGLISGSGGGGGAGVDFLSGIDEAVLVILAAVVAAVLLVVAIPLGILAFEVVLGLLVLIAGLCLRVAHVRPCTILVRQNGHTTAAFSVTGWKASQRMLRGLREQAEVHRIGRGPNTASETGQPDRAGSE
jgi:hypothetical protein